MKKELPIAVILLAFGAWCCWQLPEDSTVSDLDRTTVDASDLIVDQPQVIQTSWQGPANQAEGNGLGDGGHGSDLPPVQNSDATAVGEFHMRSFDPSAFLNAANAATAQSAADNESVDRLVQQIAALPALATHTKMVSQLFGVSLVANGKYFQTAGGRKSRMEIQCVSPVAKTVLQMSDGRFVYTLKSDRHQQKLEFIDLYRLANRRGTAAGSLLPTTWVMGGGIGESLSHYVESFDFIEVESPTDQPVGRGADGVRVFRGVWKADVMLRLLNAGVSPEKHVQSVVWKNVPRQLPHAIELTFVSPAGGGAMPRQISFFQFETDKETASAKEKVRFQLMPFQFRDQLPEDLFTLESTDFEVTDMTNYYNARIMKLAEGMDKVATQYLLEVPGVELR